MLNKVFMLNSCAIQCRIERQEGGCNAAAWLSTPQRELRDFYLEVHYSYL